MAAPADFPPDTAIEGGPGSCQLLILVIIKQARVLTPVDILQALNFPNTYLAQRSRTETRLKKIHHWRN